MIDRNRRKLYGTLAALGMISLLCTMFAIAHFLTRFLYHELQWTPPPVVVQILNSMLGLLGVMLVIWLLSYLFRNQRATQQMNLIRPILNALEAISRGNFDVEAMPNMRGREVEVFGELVTGVNNMAQQLKQMEAMRQEFISDVSHEMQSPLTSIRGFAQLLRNDQLSSTDRVHYLSVIETESERLSKLSDNLLALAALNSPTMQLAPKPYRLDKQISRLVLACEPQWAAKKLELELAVDELTINADEDLLSRVWLNLLHNSIKFTQNGGHISLTLKQCDQQIKFCIQDSGIGIAPEDQARLFERFFKADRARTQAMGGSGLGLAIVKKIVEMHEGTIQVVSPRDVGTTFTVLLPNPPA